MKFYTGGDECDGKENDYYGSKSSPEKFYRCEQGKKILEDECPENTVFDTKEKVCDHKK